MSKWQIFLEELSCYLEGHLANLDAVSCIFLYNQYEQLEQSHHIKHIEYQRERQK